MVPGFNHNIKHAGRVYHIQTEDSGKDNPHIITHIFVGGNILATKKTSYEDIVNASDLERIVKELMEEQHKSMLRNLINGVYDGDHPGDRAGEPAAAPAPSAPAAQPAAAAAVAGMGGTVSQPDGDKTLDEIILSYLADGADE